MKKMTISTCLSLLLMLTSVGAFAVEKQNPTNDSLPMPLDVKKIIDHSCFGCHNTDSKNDDAKEDLDFKTLGELTNVQRMAALKHIQETVEDNKMPPKKFLEKRPEKALTDEQKQLLIDWVKQESTSLLFKTPILDKQ